MLQDTTRERNEERRRSGMTRCADPHFDPVQARRLRRYEWRATIEGPASPRPIKTGSEADGWFGHEIYIDTGASRGALPTIVGDGEVQRQSALELSPAGFTILRWPVMFLSDTG
jgi:hypothetical protein